MRTTDSYVQAITEKLAEKAPDNIAPVPIAISQENGLWWVSVHVKRPQLADFSIDTEHADLTKALLEAYRALCKLDLFQRNSIRSDARFGIDYAANTLPAR